MVFMKRRPQRSVHLFMLVAAVLVFSACASVQSTDTAGSSSTPAANASGAAAPSAVRPTISLAYYSDPGYEMILWAAKEGKVTSDQVDLKLDAMGIVQLTQTLSTRQYDMSEVPVTAVPRLLASGAPIKAVGAGGVPRGGMDVYALIATEQSGVKNPADLKGKKLAAEALGATNFMQVRLVLAEKYGLKTTLEGGDVSFVQVPPTNMGALLQRGEVDAAYINYEALYKLRGEPGLRVISNPQKEYSETFGAPPVVSSLVAFEPTIKSKASQLAEALKLLQMSHDYYRAHRAEVEQAVAERNNVDPGFLAWWGDNYDFHIAITDEVQHGMTRLWELAVKAGELPTAPTAEAAIWRGE